MVIVMVSLNPSKTGQFVARKVIPKDARAEYKRLYGVSTEAILKIPSGHTQGAGQIAAWPVAGGSGNAHRAHSRSSEGHRATTHETQCLGLGGPLVPMVRGATRK